ncbi:hypothetical protein PR048_008619 [Dryococelus australis]|uniref:Uncharacterized protein n=1 Tax=Dryococelus australis TaxID=614101 RepID=A0ABQ9HXL3_9NEOP|nr:hypothetical protein PR048_008619 [Dryococelus australis]
MAKSLAKKGLYTEDYIIGAALHTKKTVAICLNVYYLSHCFKENSRIFSCENELAQMNETCFKWKFHVEHEKAHKASYKITMLIAQDKKPHIIGESLIKPCLLTACRTVLGEESCNQIANISLSVGTVKHRIEEMAQDLKHQII